MALLKEFKEKFSKSITLRNELIPVGKTLENIKKNHIVEDDELRNENYKKAKLIIDRFHRRVIDQALSTSTIDWEPLAALIQKPHDSNSEKQEKSSQELAKKLENYRKQIAKLFNSFEFAQKKHKKKAKNNENTIDNEENAKSEKLTFKDIFKSELFSELLPPTLENDEEKKIIEGFCRFTTYFKGFHENRKNMYSDEAKSTSIAYRVVDENFPKFLANLKIFKFWQEMCPECIERVEADLKTAELLLETDSLKTIFCVNSFNRFLGQAGIDLYNKIIGGLPAEPGQLKITGLNEQVNLTCQQNKELADKLKKKQSIKMNVLFKQILSDKDSSFVIDEFKSDEETIAAVQSFYKSATADGGSERVLSSLIRRLNEFDKEKILISGNDINLLSKDLYGAENWSLIKDAIFQNKQDDNALIKHLKKDNSPESLDKFISRQNYSIEYLSSVTGKNITDDIIKCYNSREDILLEVNKGEWPHSLKSAAEKESIKAPLDALLNIYRFLQHLASNSYDKDLNFYVDFEAELKKLSSILKLYNKVRNYATKKPYNLDKFKLNFNNPQLADGWSQTKENDYLSIILKKKDKYYLGIFNKDDKPDFSKELPVKTSECYQKMNYILFKDISKMLPKCTVSTNDVKSHFEKETKDYQLFDKQTFIKPLTITQEIFLLNSEQGTKIKKFQKAYQKIDEREYREALTKWINFGKEFLSAYKTTTMFDFSSLKPAEAYEDLNEFYSEVDNIAYKLDWVNIASDYIDELVDTGKLYLFQIYNKDFADGSTGSKNLHTLYLESIFDSRNEKLEIVKLSGYAELFYRHLSIEKKNTVVHHKGETLVNRTYVTYVDKDTRKTVQIPEAEYLEIYKFKNGEIAKEELSSEAQYYLSKAVDRIATHDIIKDRRFTEDKFFFHCPIAINYKAPSPVKFNDKVLEFLRGAPDINIIGIDRGERNLIYATVINQKGEILECKSFNCVAHNSINQNYEVDYQAKLALKEKEREQARRSWNTVTKIASIKEGYLSAVIHELTTLMIKYNAIIVLENLNMGFKRVRGGIAERSVYQKFEKMLIDKLNYLVFKANDWTEAGGVLNGYQLTNQFSSFKDISSQTGFLFYVPAAFTSKIDPTTGFINAINFGRIKNSRDQKELFSLFNNIAYEKTEDLFKFTIDYSKLKVSYDLAINTWEIYSVGTRIIRKKDNKTGKFEENLNYSPTEELKALFNQYGVNYHSENILPEILADDTKFDASFWNKLFFIFKNVLQMRNSATRTSTDYIQSPVKNSEGYFFNSENKRGTRYQLLTDADANGAYHIALKGLLMLRKNNAAKTEADIKKVRSISSKEWFEFVQKDIRKI